MHDQRTGNLARHCADHGYSLPTTSCRLSVAPVTLYHWANHGGYAYAGQHKPGAPPHRTALLPRRFATNWPQPVKDEARRLAVDEGLTRTQISDCLDVPLTTLRDWADKGGYAHTRRKRQEINAERQRCCDMCQQGYTRQEAADALGISYGMVRYYATAGSWDWPTEGAILRARKAGIEPKPRRVCPCHEEEICRRSRRAPCEVTILINGHPDTDTLALHDVDAYIEARYARYVTA